MPEKIPVIVKQRRLKPLRRVGKPGERSQAASRATNDEGPVLGWLSLAAWCRYYAGEQEVSDASDERLLSDL